MKKKLMLLYSWIIISILAQITVYAFIDKVYLKGRQNIAASMKVTTVHSSGETPVVAEEPGISLDIPADVKEIKISFDGSYAAYILNKKLYVVDINSKKIKKVIENQFVGKDNLQNEAEANITSYQWIPNKNTMLYGLSALPEASGKVQLFTYDAVSENDHIGVTFSEDYVPEGGELKDLVISPLTMVFYAKIKMNDSQDRLFRIDLMDQMFPSITIQEEAATKIGYYTEDLVYEDGNGNLYVKSGFKNPYQIQSTGNLALLNVVGVRRDGKDRIYAGQLNVDNKVDKIIYGVQGAEMASWQSIDIEKPQTPDCFVIKEEDEIYSVNQEEGYILDIWSGNKTTFAGKFVDIVNKYIAYRDQNVLKLKPIK